MQLGRSPSHIKTFGFYKEIRIENTLTDENGREVKLTSLKKVAKALGVSMDELCGEEAVA